MNRLAKYCTHCGRQLMDKNNKVATSLYDEDLHKKSNILKLKVCSSCGQVADKYIECDGTLLLIDLALQTKEAYRYFNSSMKFPAPFIHSFFSIII